MTAAPHGETAGPPTIGVDLGGTKLLAVVADADGRVVAERRRLTSPDPDSTLGGVIEVVAELRAEVPAAAALGLGVAGMIDFDGVVRNAPNLPGWEGLAVGDAVVRCGLPVAVDNDANVAALAEARYGAAAGRSDVLLITLGTGVGGGIIAGGEVYRGAFGVAAEIGHFVVDPDGPKCACGAVGHWEAIASGTALGRVGREWAAAGDAPNVARRAGGQIEAVTGYHVGEAARAGEPDGLALLAAYARNVAIGLGGLVNILDPGLIVIAGGLVELGAVLLDPIRAELAQFVEAPDRREMPAVVAALLGERAGAIGAAALARALI